MSISTRFRLWHYFTVAGLLLPLLLSLNGCGGKGDDRMNKPGSGTPVTVTGTVQYEDRTYDTGGFTGKTLKPVRSAVVEIVRNADEEVLASGATQQDGSYSLTFTHTGTAGVYVSVLAKESDDTVVVEDTSGVLYAIKSLVIDDSAAGSFNMNLNATVTAGGGVFNILDVFLEAADFIFNLTGESPPLVTAIWEAGSCNGTFFSPSFNTIDILGGCEGDTDEYDDTVLLHEYGHFIAAHYSNDDSPGGAHFLNENTQDIRLSWSEGWGHFFAGAVREDPLYVDTIGDQATIVFEIEELSSPMMELSTLSTLALYTTNELSVSAVLWDIFDTTPGEILAGGTDVVSAGMIPIWDVIANYLTCTTCSVINVSMEDFWDGWFNCPVCATVNHGSQTGMETVVADRKMALTADSFETLGGKPDDNTTANASTIAVGVSQSHTLYPAGDVNYMSFTASGSMQYTIQTLGLTNGADTLLEVLDTNGTTVLESNDNADGETYNTSCGVIFFNCPSNDDQTLSSQVTFNPSAPGTYYIRIRSSPDAPPSAGVYGGYQIQVTFP